ncbi:ABC transporter ATP-binding protein [Gemella bergeri]
MLEFNNYKKKINKNNSLELDFKIDKGEILSIISDSSEGLNIIKESFQNRTKYKGNILFDNKKIEKEKIIFIDDYGFYENITVLKNLKQMLTIFKIGYSAEKLKEKLQLLSIDENKKYKNLEKKEKIKFHILFSLLIKQKLLIIEDIDNSLSKEDKIVIKNLLLTEKSRKTTVVILDTMLNRLTELANTVIVISNCEKSYYGLLKDLLIIKKLAAVTVSHQDDLEIILQNYQYTIYNDKEIVVREEVLEDIVYELLKNNIEVYQIRNLGEKIKLYEEEGD